MDGYNHPLHALIIWGLVFFFRLRWADLYQAERKMRKKFFLILSLIREEKKGLFFFLPIKLSVFQSN
jgi:hypothetical protein